MTDPDAQETALAFMLQMIGAELVDRAAPGTCGAHTDALADAHRRGELTDEELREAVKRAVTAEIRRQAAQESL